MCYVSRWYLDTAASSFEILTKAANNLRNMNSFHC